MNDTTSVLPHIKLRFNIEHPSYEECYVFGYECALAELSEDDNPFLQNSKEAEQWAEGWWAGVYGEKPLFALNWSEEEAQEEQDEAANDQEYHFRNRFFTLVLEVGGAIAASAFVGYQLLELVA